MLKHVHDLKKDLREKGWWERDSPEVSQTSFLRSENQMQNWDLSLNDVSLESCHYIAVTFVPQLLIGSLD